MIRFLLSALLAVPAGAAPTAMSQLEGAAQRGASAPQALDAEGARQGAGEAFEPIDETIFEPVERPRAQLEPHPGDLVVGKPQKLREPKNPLDAKGELKSQKSGSGGFFSKLLWALGFAVLTAGVGFLVGGPIGAAIGGVIGGVIGWTAAP